MFDLKPKRYSFLVTFALLLVGAASTLLWSSVFGHDANGAVAAGPDLPEPGILVVMAIGAIAMLRRRTNGRR